MKKSDIAKCVILHPVTIESQTDYPVHRSLRAVDNNTLLSRLTPEMTGSPNEYIIPQADALHPFSMWPQVTDNTRRLLNDCSLDIDFNTPKNKKIYSASRYDDKLLWRSWHGTA